MTRFSANALGHLKMKKSWKTPRIEKENHHLPKLHYPSLFKDCPICLSFHHLNPLTLEPLTVDTGSQPKSLHPNTQHPMESHRILQDAESNRIEKPINGIYRRTPTRKKEQTYAIKKKRLAKTHWQQVQSCGKKNGKIKSLTHQQKRTKRKSKFKAKKHQQKSPDRNCVLSNHPTQKVQKVKGKMKYPLFPISNFQYKFPI